MRDRDRQKQRDTESHRKTETHRETDRDTERLYPSQSHKLSANQKNRRTSRVYDGYGLTLLLSLQQEASKAPSQGTESTTQKTHRK